MILQATRVPSSFEVPSFEVLHELPSPRVEQQWRACLAGADLPTHYTAPEYFLEPALRGKKPFAVLSVVGDAVTAVLTGIHVGDRVQSGLSVRPQIAFSRHVDRARAMRSLVAGMLREADRATLIDLFVWADLAAEIDDQIVDAGFRRRRCDGVVMLELTPGPEALFRELAPSRQRNIRRAIRSGVSVEIATSRDDVSAFYAVYVDWSRRKALPPLGQEEFHDTFALRGNRRLFVARRGGKIVAGTVLRFFPGGLVEYAANSSLHEALDVRPN